MIDHDAIAPIVKANSASIRRTYPMVEGGDLDGVQWEWVYSNPDKVKAFQEGEAMGLLSFRLKSVATRWAAGEREVQLGRDPEDLYMYNIATVRELLKDVFHHEHWQSGSQGGDGMPTGSKVVSHGGDRVAMLGDVSAALKQIPQDQWNVLVWVYKYGYSHEQVAETLEISVEAARKRTDRAVERVRMVLMGIAPSTSEAGDPNYVGRRRAMSNAQARAITSSYDDQ